MLDGGMMFWAKDKRYSIVNEKYNEKKVNKKKNNNRSKQKMLIHM